MLGIVYLLSVSTIMGVMGLVILWRRCSLFIHGARATGQFVRWELRGLRGEYFYPVVAFQAHDGKAYEFTGGSGSTTKKEEKSYRIVYPPDHPEKAMILSFLAFWAAPLAFFALSAGAAAAAWQQK